VTIRQRAHTLYARARGSGPMWKRLAVLVIAAVAIYGIYSAYESSTANGRRLDRALDALRHANATNDDLKVLLIQANNKTGAFRKALKAAGVAPAQIRRIERQAAASGGGGSGGGPTPQPGPQPGPQPSHSPQPGPQPSHSPHPGPGPSPTPRPTPCTAYNPLTGRCAVRLPVPLPTAAPGTGASDYVLVLDAFYVRLY
jgi:hypothetical protein